MIGLSTSWLGGRGIGIYDSVKKIHSMGFGLIELGANHPFERNVWSELKAIKKDFPGVKFTVHGYFPRIYKQPYFVNPCYGLTDKNKRAIESIFRAARTVEAVIVGLHPGHLSVFSEQTFEHQISGMFGFNHTAKLHPDKAYGSAQKYYQYAIAQSKRLGIPLAFENVPADGDPLFKSQSDYRKFMETHPRVKILWDLGHSMTFFRNPYWLLKHTERIGEIHVHDAMGQRDHMALGRGQLDLKRVFSQPFARSIPLIFEHGTDVTEKEILREKKLLEGIIKG